MHVISVFGAPTVVGDKLFVQINKFAKFQG